MFLLRRAAARSLSAQPSVFLSKPRTFVTKAPVTLTATRQWNIQRRFASNEPTSSAEAGQALKEDAQDAAEPVVEKAQETASELQEETEEARSSVSETAQNVSDTIRETAASTAAAAQDMGRGAASAVMGRSSNNQGSGSFEQPTPGRSLYVGNLFFETTTDALRSEFSQFGEIVDCRVVQDNQGLSKGFGFVEFADQEAATRAQAEMDQTIISGRRVAVQYHVRRERPTREGGRAIGNRDRGSFTVNPPSKTLFIGNMSFQMSDKDLNDSFKNIRNVVDVRVAIDRRSGQPRGFAHAEFVDIPSAEAAKEELSNKVIFGRQLRVDFSRDSPRSSYASGEGGDMGDRGDRGFRNDRGDRGDRGFGGDRGDRGFRSDRGGRGDRGDRRERY